MSCSASGPKLCRIVPRFADRAEKARGDFDRRENASAFARIPGQDLRGAIDIRIREPGFRAVHQPRGHDRALFARVGADRLPFFEKQKRRQRAARLDASGRDQLRNIEDVNGRKTGVFRFRRVDPGESGVGGAEVDADFHSPPSSAIVRAR